MSREESATPTQRPSPTRRALLQMAAGGTAAGIAAPWRSAPIAASPTPSSAAPPTAARYAQATDGGFSASGRQQMHETMAAIVERGAAPGLVTLVSRGGEIHADAIGTMALDGEEPNGATRWRFAR